MPLGRYAQIFATREDREAGSLRTDAIRPHYNVNRMRDELKLWVDDQRPAPHGWVHARTYAEAIRCIREFGPQLIEVSLDHDLNPAHTSGDYTDCTTGYDVLVYLLRHGLRPTIHFHTMNPEGLQRMTDLLESGEE